MSTSTSTPWETMHAKSISRLFNRLKPTSRKTSKDGDNSGQLPQPPALPNGNTVIASTTVSTQDLSKQSVWRPQLGRRSTRYVIIASQSSRPESNDVGSVMAEFSARKSLPHTVWDRQASINSLQSHASECRRNDGLDFFRGLGYRLRRPPRRYPPTSYRGPFALACGDGDAQRLLHTERNPQICPSPSGSMPSKSSSSSGRRKQELPPPEEIYTQPMYYTQCPHTCPPAHRPLNAAPILQDLTPDLVLNLPSSTALAAQLDLAVRTAGWPRQIYTIAGLCPDCDLSRRRAAETEVLAAFAIQQRRHYDHYIAHSNSDEFSPSSSLVQLQREQDRQIEKIWAGFAARWGPGPVGIQRSPSGRNNNNGPTPVASEGRMKLDWLRPDLPKAA